MYASEALSWIAIHEESPKPKQIDSMKPISINTLEDIYEQKGHKTHTITVKYILCELCLTPK